MACSVDQITLPCSLPHLARCLSPTPGVAPESGVRDAFRPRLLLAEFGDAGTLSHTAAHVNRLELPHDPSLQLVASFENVLVNLNAIREDLTTCVWNALDIRDFF